MSEQKMPETLDPGEERDRDWLGEVLDDPHRAVAVAEGEADHEAGVRCEYLALLGALPESLEAVEVPPELEGRVLLAAAAASAAGVGGQRESGSRAGTDRPRRATARRWLLPLAATVAFAAVALSSWQATRLGELRATVRRQSEQLAVARETAERLATMEAENAEQAAALALLTAAGAEFCPLRPPAESPVPEAYGALAMAADGSHWYVRAVGLEPRPGHEVRLWFLRDGEPIASVVLPAAGETVELMEGTAPRGFNSVAVTLEPSGSDRPSGPRLLFGNERMRIL